jgi:hypothetical protein
MSEPLRIEGVDGFLRGKRFSFSKTSVSLGTDASCDVRLDPVWDKSVAPRHAVVRWDGQQWLLEDSGKGATLVDGRAVRSLGLEGETTIQLGQGGPKLRVVPPGAPVEVSPAAQAAVPEVQRHVRAHGRASKRYALVGVVVLLASAGVATVILCKRDERVAAWFASLLQRVSGRPAQGAPDSGQVQNAPAQIVMEMGDQLFPSYLIASATMSKSPFDELHAATPLRLGDKRGTIGVDLPNPAPNTRVRIWVEENEMIRGSVFDCVMPEEGSRYQIYPTIQYRYEALARVRQTTPLSIAMKVQVGSEPAVTLSRAVRVASINDCPFRMLDVRDPNGREAVDLRWMFAAYVNENHPISDEIRQEALSLGVVKQFTGYHETEREVFLQVFAFWNALQRRGVKYSSITSTPSPPVSLVISQYVRFLDQSVNNSQANCVDGTVLFASLLRQIGIEPFLVMLPGHMLLGFAIDPDGREVLYLETTCIGSHSGEGPEELAASVGLKNFKPLESRRARVNQKSQGLRSLLEPVALQNVDLKNSLESFCFALLLGTQTVEEAMGSEGAGAEASRPNASQGGDGRKKDGTGGFARISIALARQLGILPIAYQR